MPAKKVVAANAVKVKVKVTLHEEALDTKQMYLLGNIKELGAWNVTKAKKLKLKKGYFEGAFDIEQGTEIEFKVLNDKDWQAVEKGMHGEELDNHVALINEETEIVIGVQKWNN